MGARDPCARRPRRSARVQAARLAPGLIPALLTAALLIPGASRGQSPEIAKANDLYMLARFATWPPTAFAGAGAPFVICIQGPDPFQRRLDETVAGQRVGGRPIEVARLMKLDAGSGCAVAYVSGSAAQSRTAALEAVRAAPVLTVTDDVAGPGPRGIVHFVLVGGRVRFELDTRLADAAGVTISSRLLALAVRVVR
jgi:hypothetical protein